ncbi:MAG TPA: methylenetetrahydrofolate--tRNA-(uracil(54)-C(5))-methyltransferase (FADH(2)-oxidizing) TrmFO [Polyangiaceae bacterium]|nr:methylenetetrahydrofolate--tRNA-(uracil(54)-C(5))-methyltransferase (FADH(2)-oxidizing) TrmFO [Polyangiaceae bacterium]
MTECRTLERSESSDSNAERRVTIVGAGLAECEAAFKLAERGFDVVLVEQKPHARTPAQTSDQFCELVCSNSMRGAALTNAVGLLKEELRRAGSLILRSADESAIPAGGALAVDRERFSERVTSALAAHPRIRIERRVVDGIPAMDHPVILATGPLTGEALAEDLARTVGREHLAYYDAIAPIVAADSIDTAIVYRKSRYDKGGDDYLNCPMDEAQYRAFVAAVLAAQKVEARAFEDVRYFEGCLPIEVMAVRGEMTLAFGPMKPVGLEDPRTGKRPFAVVQLRQEDEGATAYNMVGFQTRMTWPEQKRVFCMIPGLERAEFMRMGSVHRNTFIDAPRCLDERMQLRARPGVFLAGQVSGVEGYVESCAGGFLCALLLAGVAPPPKTTALGGILGHLSRPNADYQPSNITWAHVAPLPMRAKKHVRYEAMAARALRDLGEWLAAGASLRKNGTDSGMVTPSWPADAPPPPLPPTPPSEPSR